jgi:predicted component of type VI protein secretion system
MKAHEIEGLLRSLALAPLSPESVRDALESHRELLAQREELEKLLRRLLPAWAECRQVLNELMKQLD